MRCVSPSAEAKKVKKTSSSTFTKKQKVRILFKALMNRQELLLGEYIYRYFKKGDDIPMLKEVCQVLEDLIAVKMTVTNGKDKPKTTWLVVPLPMTKFIQLCREASDEVVVQAAANNGLKEVNRKKRRK